MTRRALNSPFPIDFPHPGRRSTRRREIARLTSPPGFSSTRYRTLRNRAEGRGGGGERESFKYIGEYC